MGHPDHAGDTEGDHALWAWLFQRWHAWKTFLQNHLGNMISIDFFTVPTLTFQVLSVFIVLSHHCYERRAAETNDSP